MYDFDGLQKDDEERATAARIQWEHNHPNWREEARKRKAEENKFRREYYGLHKLNADRGGFTHEMAE